MARDFYKVSDLTKAFEEVEGDYNLDQVNSRLLWFQAKAQIAIAQQLAVISSTLNDLMAAVDRSEKRERT